MGRRHLIFLGVSQTKMEIRREKYFEKKYQLKQHDSHNSSNSCDNTSIRSSHRRFLKTLQNLQENTCARVSFLIKLQASRSGPLLKKETLALVFSCEFCKMSKSTFLTEDLWGDCFGSIIFQFSSACNISVYSSKY